MPERTRVRTVSTVSAETISSTCSFVSVLAGFSIISKTVLQRMAVSTVISSHLETQAFRHQLCAEPRPDQPEAGAPELLRCEARGELAHVLGGQTQEWLCAGCGARGGAHQDGVVHVAMYERLAGL